MDSQERRAAVAPAHAQAQKAVGVATVLANKLRAAWERLPAAYAGAVQESLDDAAEMARLADRIARRMADVPLARAAA